MSSGISVVSYELYTFNGGRWELEARFTRAERDKAIEEAKRIEKDLKFGVRVVREEYSPSENTSDESVIYKSTDGFISEVSRRARTAQASPKRAAGGREEPAMAATSSSGKAAVAAVGASLSSLGVDKTSVIKVSGLLGISFVAAAILTLVIGLLLGKVMHIDPDTASIIDLGVFVLSFLAFSLPRMNKAIGETGPSAPRQSGPTRPVRRAPPPSDLDLDIKLDDDEKSEEDEAGEDDKEDKKEEEAEAAGENAEAAAGQPISGDDDQKTLLQFLAVVVPEVMKVQPQLDAFNLIGIDLMLAGAADVLGNRSGIDTAERKRILRTAIEKLGTKPDTAKSFADKVEEYMVEPRYLSMVQAGMTAMEAYIAGETKFNIGSVFKSWNKPQAAQSQPRIMTVMFTDMVGSTDLTQAVGDQAAQEVVRRHNSIVRAIIAEYAGKEIKHTGDGIMMSFPSAINGVEASIAIQKAIAGHNARFSDLPLHVRIGINAGEPIEEEEDLFGGTVQLAARVCAFAGTDQIVCSSVVRELAGGNKSITFNSCGAQKLKGFTDAITLFEVAWH